MTILAGTISYPWDTAVRRIMVDSGRPDHLKQFKGSWDAVVSIYRQGGFIAFYRVKKWEISLGTRNVCFCSRGCFLICFGLPAGL